MAISGTILCRSGGATLPLSLSNRDVHLLDGRHFFKHGWEYREMLGLDFVRGISTAPPSGVVLLRHDRKALLSKVEGLLAQLQAQHQLISFNYSYGFEDEPKRRSGGAMSGFKVKGGFGAISVRPAGYCDLTISDIGPDGRGREIAAIDMRVCLEYDTLDKGKLRVYRRKAEVGWFDGLEKLIGFLADAPSETIEISHIE